MLGPEIAMGPGKADLLQGIKETGSIAGAGRRLRMSYRRAWLLVETMNACFKAPLVEARKGGKTGGTAVLTKTGEDVLARYRRIEETALSTTKADRAALQRLLRAGP
jgi:molybdate transport system regulatory protein